MKLIESATDVIDKRGQKFRFHVDHERLPKASIRTPSVPSSLPKTVPVGRYRGQAFASIPKEHLEWLLREELLPDEHLWALSLFLGIRRELEQKEDEE